jgi:hypothetical protein
MAVTFAGNGIYLGALAGIATAVVTGNAAAGIVVAIVASVAAWYGIRAMEKLLGRGVNAGFSAASNWMNRPRPSQQHQPSPQWQPHPVQQQYLYHQYPNPQYPPAAQPPQGQAPSHIQNERPWG